MGAFWQAFSSNLSLVKLQLLIPPQFSDFSFLQSYAITRSIWKMLGPFVTASRLMPIHQVSLAVLSRAACTLMSTTITTTTTTTTTTTRDKGDRYGPMEWAQKPMVPVIMNHRVQLVLHRCDVSSICRSKTTSAFCPPYLFQVWRRHLAMWLFLPLKRSSLIS